MTHNNCNNNHMSSRRGNSNNRDHNNGRINNRNASIISMCVGWVVLALFAEGLLRLVGAIDPLFPWLKITLPQ